MAEVASPARPRASVPRSLLVCVNSPGTLANGRRVAEAGLGGPKLGRIPLWFGGESPGWEFWDLGSSAAFAATQLHTVAGSRSASVSSFRKWTPVSGPFLPPAVVVRTRNPSHRRRPQVEPVALVLSSSPPPLPASPWAGAASVWQGVWVGPRSPGMVLWTPEPVRAQSEGQVCSHWC